MPFDQAVEEVRKLAKAEIMVDWKDLEKAGIDRKSPIYIHGTDVCLSSVLESLTNNNATNFPRVTYIGPPSV